MDEPWPTAAPLADRRVLRVVYLFGLAGMPAEIALAPSLLSRLLNLLMALPGAWFYIRHGVVASSR